MAINPGIKGLFAKKRGWFLGGAAILVVVVAAILVYSFILRGNVTVTALNLSNGAVEYGKQTEARVVIENKGVFPVKYNGMLSIDGVDQPLGEVQLEPKIPQTLTASLSNLKQGTHTVSIGGLEKEIRVLKPAEFELTSLLLNPADSIFTGDTVLVVATVRNIGEVKGTYQAQIDYNGAPVPVQAVNIEPGTEQILEAKITVDKKGTHSVSMEDQKQSFVAVNPANINVTAMDLSKVYSSPGEPVLVTATLKNTGDVEDTISLGLFVNGSLENMLSETVEANGTTTCTFTVAPEKTGKYVLKAGGYSRVLQVVTISRPANGTTYLNRISGGYSKITFQNKYKGRDAYVVITNSSGAIVYMAYVRAGSTVKNVRIKDGTYNGSIITGSGFDTSSRSFTSMNSAPVIPVYLWVEMTYSSDYYYKCWYDFTIQISPSNTNGAFSTVFNMQ